MKLLKPEKSALSVDLGARDIKVIEGKFNKKGVMIAKSFKMETPEGTYKDGEALNIEVLSKELKKGFSVNNVETDLVHLVVNSTKIITRDIEIPKVNPSEVNSLISFQLGNYIPVDPENYTARTLLLEDIMKDNAEHMRMLLIGVPTEIVTSHYNLLDRAGLKPVYMDYQGNAIRKLLCTSNVINGTIDYTDKTIAAVDIGSSTTNISIIKGEELRLSRVVEIGYKQAKGDTNLESICDRIGMVLKYYTSRGEENSIDIIVLHGGIVNLPGVKQEVENNLGIHAEVLNSLNNIKFNDELYTYANAIGGLIRLED